MPGASGQGARIGGSREASDWGPTAQRWGVPAVKKPMGESQVASPWQPGGTSDQRPKTGAGSAGSAGAQGAQVTSGLCGPGTRTLSSVAAAGAGMAGTTCWANSGDKLPSEPWPVPQFPSFICLYFLI